MNIARKFDTITTKLDGEQIKIKIEWLSLESDWMSFKVDTRQEALMAAYAYRYSPGSDIERATDGGYVVVIRKKVANSGA